MVRQRYGSLYRAYRFSLAEVDAVAAIWNYIKDVSIERPVKSDKILEKLSEKNFYINLEKNFAEILKSKILNDGINNIALTIKPASFYEGSRKNRYNIKDLIEISKVFQIDLEDC